MSLKMVTSVPYNKRKESVDELTVNLKNTIDNIGSISDEQLDQAVSELGYMNDCAYKGYRKLKDEWRELNDKIYELKSIAVYSFATEYKKRGKDVSYGTKEKVVYFRREDGMQISFHMPQMNDAEMSFYTSLPPGEWDRVEYAYSFSDIQDYKMIIEQRKEAEAIATEIADKHKNQNVERVINHLRYCSDWRLAFVYRINPKSATTTYVSKMDGYNVRPYISSFHSDLIVRDALGNCEQSFFDRVDAVLEERGLPFKFDRNHSKLVQTKMGRKSVGKSKKTSTRKKVA